MSTTTHVLVSPNTEWHWDAERRTYVAADGRTTPELLGLAIAYGVENPLLVNSYWDMVRARLAEVRP